MSKYQQFIFKGYIFDRAHKTLSLDYSYDGSLSFTEKYTFDFDFIDYNPEALDRALQLLFFVAGVSYFKAYLPPQIKVEAGQLDTATAVFLNKLYSRGLGEFFYLNQLDPNTVIEFPVNSPELDPVEVKTSDGQLIGLGGGKDSLVSVDLLRDQPKVVTWSLNHQEQLQPLVERLGLPHLRVTRQWDDQLLALNKQDAMNGHIPISAIFSCVGSIVSILTGYKDAVVSNESSANEPTLTYRGVPINHQYSKSLEYEKDFQGQLAHTFGDTLRYFSLLRPFTELRIAELFAARSFSTCKDVFSSCNRAYRHDQKAMFWCGECAKCAFVFLIFTPFIERISLEALWDGKNLLLDPSLQTTYRQLLGIEGDKPLDCIGEIRESRTAMSLAQAVYPQLGTYEFVEPLDYDFRAWSNHTLPSEMLEMLQTKLLES